jgi:hypothetical protein
MPWGWLTKLGWTEEQYRENPIAGAEITFKDAKGNVILTTAIDLRPYDGALWNMGDSHARVGEFLFSRKAGERFRDALAVQASNLKKDD